MTRTATGPDDGTDAAEQEPTPSRRDRTLLEPGALLGPSTDAPRWIRIASVAALTLMTWPFQPGVSAGYGVDSSWEIALSMLRDHAVVWGRDVVFNYGPLGFLGAVNGASFAGWTFQILVSVLCAWLAVRLLSRAVSAPVAAAVTAVVFVVVFGPQAVPVVMRIVIVAVLWSLDLVLRAPRVALWTAALVGAACGATVMIKADTALVVAALTAVAIGATALVTAGLRRAAAAVGAWLVSAAVTAVGLFALFGGPLDQLGPWLRGTVEIVGGFSSAMGVSRNPPWSLYEQLAAIALAVAIVVLVALEAKLPAPRRVAATILSAVAVFLAFRQGFVRYDFWHVRQFYVVVAVIPFAFAGIWSLRRLGVLVVAPLLILVPTQHPSPSVAVMPARGVVWAARSVADLVRPGQLAELRAQRSTGIRDHYRLPPAMLERIGDDRVAIIPQNVEIADGYPELNWVPMPLLQDYQANTAALDRLGVDFLTSDRAPRWIIRSRGATRVDRRFPRFDPPGENLALLCNYRSVLSATNGLELLEHRPDRCGTPEVTATGTERLGRAVRVPTAAPDEMVVARFSGIDAGILPKLQGTLLRGARYRISVDGVERPWRYVPGTQSSWHVLRAPRCVDLGTTGPSVDELTIDAPGRVLGSDAFEVTFARIPVDCG